MVMFRVLSWMLGDGIGQERILFGMLFRRPNADFLEGCQKRMCEGMWVGGGPVAPLPNRCRIFSMDRGSHLLFGEI